MAAQFFTFPPAAFCPSICNVQLSFFIQVLSLMHLLAFCLQASASEDCFWQCYEGLQKVARKLRLLIEWQVPTGSSGVWAWSGQGEETATSSITKQLGAVMTHPVPSYEPTLFPWGSTTPIPAERAPHPWWMWDWADDTKGLQQFGVTALCCIMPRGTGTFVWPPAGRMTHCSAPLAQCSEVQRLRHGKPLMALSSALCPA